MTGTLFGTVFLEAFAALGCMGLTLALAVALALALEVVVRAGHAPRLAELAARRTAGES